MGHRRQRRELRPGFQPARQPPGGSKWVKSPQSFGIVPNIGNYLKNLEGLPEPMYIAKPKPFAGNLSSDRDTWIFMPQLPVEIAGDIHWDKLQHLQSAEASRATNGGFASKFGRARSLRHILPLLSADHNTASSYVLTDQMLRSLHYIDQHCSGELAMPERVLHDDHARPAPGQLQPVEEAVRAKPTGRRDFTSRRSRRAPLRTGRPPRDRSERMIINHYRALNSAGMACQPDALTPGAVLELSTRILHRRDAPAAAATDEPGRLQRPDEERVKVFKSAQVERAPPHPTSRRVPGGPASGALRIRE